jgi:hypothetical protein
VIWKIRARRTCYMVLLGVGGEKSLYIPIRSSPPGMLASCGVSGGVSMPFSRGASSILLGAVVSVVVTGAVGMDGTGSGWPAPKK